MDAIITRIDRSPLLSQLIPLGLTLVVMAVLISILHGVLLLLNLLPVAQEINMTLRWYDIIIGATIYLKTSIDFAIFMGRMMAANPGWKSRIAIEIGTALGNAIGTISIIALWVFLKDIHILLAIMVFIASLVLFELAHASLEHFETWESASTVKRLLFRALHVFLDTIKKLVDPILLRIMPDLSAKMQGKAGLTWLGLIQFAITVPFILGLDDFAGYVPLFTVVNVYGFAVGVIGAHTVLNIALFLSPNKTIIAVKNEVVSFLGALAFIGLGIYGMVETVRIIVSVF
jgi:hypothetical protein